MQNLWEYLYSTVDYQMTFKMNKLLLHTTVRATHINKTVTERSPEHKKILWMYKFSITANKLAQT